MKTFHVSQVVSLAATLAFAPAACSQPATAWPERPVRVIVAYAPGGTTDIVARVLAIRLSSELGQQFLIDNRPGAGGTTGTLLAVRANPDGYTGLVMGAGYTANAALYKLPFDPVKGLAPVSLVGTAALIMAMNPTVKAANLREFVDLVRARPGALNYASAGAGSFPHLAIELFRQLSGTDIVHVPYKGDGAALADLIAGQVQMTIVSGPALLPHIKSGRLRALAVTSERRVTSLPDVPAIAEVVPGYSVRTWFGMWLTAGSPAPVIARLNQAIARVVAQPEMQERLRADGLDPQSSTPAEFEREIVRDIEKWTKVVKAGNISVD